MKGVPTFPCTAELLGDLLLKKDMHTEPEGSQKCSQERCGVV